MLWPPPPSRRRPRPACRLPLTHSPHTHTPNHSTNTQVLKEVELASKAYPDAYVRMCAFDASRQVQVTSMLVHRPPSSKDYRLPADRAV